MAERKSEGSPQTNIYSPIKGPVHTGSGNIIYYLQKHPVLLYVLLVLALMGCFTLIWAGAFFERGGTISEFLGRFSLPAEVAEAASDLPVASPTSTMNATATMTSSPPSTRTPISISTVTNTPRPTHTPTFTPVPTLLFEQEILEDSYWEFGGYEGTPPTPNPVLGGDPISLQFEKGFYQLCFDIGNAAGRIIVCTEGKYWFEDKETIVLESSSENFPTTYKISFRQSYQVLIMQERFENYAFIYTKITD